MKTKICVVALLGAWLVVLGCVSTVDEHKTFGVPGIKDSAEARYERSPEEILRAVKAVLVSEGMLNNEGTIYSQSKQIRTVEGKVNQRSVWVRIEPIDSKVTRIVVQTRTRGGGSDVELAHQIDKEVALKLAH
jgi:ABC-type xylose transport system substrate-binding protein